MNHQAAVLILRIEHARINVSANIAAGAAAVAAPPAGEDGGVLVPREEDDKVADEGPDE
jgi:hypothetical protein